MAFPGLQGCLLITCSTEKKTIIYYFERVDILYHWYMQEKVKKIAVQQIQMVFFLKTKTKT